MSPAPRLRLAGVTVTYPDGDHRRTVLDHIEFEAGAGEFVGVSGPSGSGKSTLLAVAGALLRPDSGQVWLDTAELTSLSREKAAKLRRNSVGFVFQDANLLPSLSALDQLLFTCALAGTRPSRHRARAQQLLDDVGLTDRTHMRPDHLSGGERQRVAIARALINNPAILLVDEPTASIDATQTSGIVGLLADQAHRHHCALIMVTHDPAALSACDRTTTITALAAPSRP